MDKAEAWLVVQEKLLSLVERQELHNALGVALYYVMPNDDDGEIRIIYEDESIPDYVVKYKKEESKWLRNLGK